MVIKHQIAVNNPVHTEGYIDHNSTSLHVVSQDG